MKLKKKNSNISTLEFAWLSKNFRVYGKFNEFKFLRIRLNKNFRYNFLRIIPQLLTGGIKIDYNYWFQTPMTITTERAWLQISQRYEFQEAVKLSVQDTVMVAFISSQCKT